MYEIRPESIITFITDTSVRLPRFQRKQTWDAKKNFELCISVFKEFPIGVTILNVESDDRGSTTKWLLDGRQRRNALLKLWEDPENIYDWARKWIRFKTNDQPADVEEKFRAKITNYLEDDDLDIVSENSNEEAQDIDDPGEIFHDETDSRVLAERPMSFSNEGIDFLLEIIMLIHNKTSKYSGFTRPFDFTKDVGKLPYVESKDGKVSLSSRKLKSFITNYKQYCVDERLEAEDPRSFKSFMDSRFPNTSDIQAKIGTQVDNNWESILERIKILERIDSFLMQSKIGLIELKNIQTTDSQKIFNIINSKGTKLNAVEILSAKPSWNAVIKQPTALQSDAAKELYKQIEVKNDGVVKWDLPATILPRLNDASFFFQFGGDASTGLDKQLTLGFKLLSGLFENGVRKEDIDALSKNGNIDWELNFDTIVSEINNFTKVILTSTYFNFLRSWGVTLSKITSDAVALNLFLILYKDWERKGKPIGSDTSTRIFQKNAFILMDQVLFEYVNREWRGSSDSRIARNLNQVTSLSSLFSPVTNAQWVGLLDDIFDKNEIAGVKISQPVMEPLLYHFYCLMGIAGPTGGASIEVDHIIPQTLFKQAPLPDAEALVHNLFNLALLPKRLNISKSNKRLIEITDQWLKSQVYQYAFIEEKDFGTFSDLTHLTALKELRAPIFREAYGLKRDAYLAN